MSKGWDSGMLKKLKALVGKGLSASEMGKKLGMSKNAVIGKLNRLGWNSKTAEPAKKKVAANKKEAKVVESKTKKTVTRKIEKPVAKPSKATAVVKSVGKTSVKSAKKAKETREEKVVVKSEPKIKTASKKTKKDLALHELLIQHALQMANLKPNQCRWPIGDPDSDSFHFCGETVFSGKPYCYEHCRQAYQFTAPKKK